MNKRKRKILTRANLIVRFDCGTKRCKSCGAPVFDDGPVCGNCDEDPDEKPCDTITFDPKIINQVLC